MKGFFLNYFHLYLTALLLTVTFSACNQFSKIQKSKDPQVKYDAAKKYYADRHYLKAYTLLEDIVPYYKGTPESHEVLFLLGKCYEGNKDYLLANSYYTTYTKSFPRHSHAEEAWFLRGETLSKSSPDPKLDQTDTRNAISAFQDYVSLYPDGQWKARVDSAISALRDKLAEKEFANAKLYYNLGNYLGNNYQSAVITAQNAIRDYPESKHVEELNFLILQSKYQQAKHSVKEKQTERYEQTQDEYYNFASSYPNSRFKKDADKIFEETRQFLKN